VKQTGPVRKEASRKVEKILFEKFEGKTGKIINEDVCWSFSWRLFYDCITYPYRWKSLQELKDFQKGKVTRDSEK
jgi:hypothetical protein